MPRLAFSLNGVDTVVSYDTGMHLLEVLRERCGITTVKDGCSPQGYCGCCTILLDGRPALACLLDPQQVQDRSVTTLEGLPERQRQLLASAFVHEGAIQCGYCTPGIMVRAASLLERGQAIDRSRVARALSGHLCRCTGYTRIVDAIETAGEAWPRDELQGGTAPRRSDFFGAGRGRERSSPPPTRAGGIGASARRYRGVDHALGEKGYVADLQVEGMLHGALVLSEHPRARVLAIDSSAAAAMPGVVRILTAADIPGESFHGLIVRDWPLMVAVGEITRCVGDVLAIVIADSQFRARQAAQAVQIDYEVLTPVTDPVAALDPDAPRVHEAGNLLETCAFRRGDVEQALADSAHVVEETFTTQRIEHAFLEPEACLTVPTANGVKLYSQGQGVHDDQRQVAAILGLDPSLVEVELVTNGGAFGGKEDLAAQGHAALAAHLLRRPVRVVLTREQSMRLHPKRHPLVLHYTVGCDDQGRLTAARARIIGDTGAYASVGAKVLERAAGHFCGPYRVPNVDVVAKAVYTNNPPCGAMRGFGVNQAAFAIDGMLDRLAARVGLDGYDIRERNILDPGDRFATGQLMDSSCGIRATLEAVRDAYKDARCAGISCGIKNTGIGNGMEDIGRVEIRVLDHGRLEILCGYTEMGQGLHTVLRQVLCHETGLDPAIMAVRTTSDPAVECGMTTASRATALSCEAARRAAATLAADLQAHELTHLSGRTYHGEVVHSFTTKPGAEVDEPVTHMAFGFATQVVILDDEGRIERVIAAHDVGRAINPLACVGQIEGAVHMGLGYALSEDFPCTGGRPDSLLLRDLGILKAAETPPVEVILIEVPDRVGGYGAKGIGEIGLVPTAAAVAAALHAFDGKHRNRLPMARKTRRDKP
jgi:aldehyde oxidoreductase